MNKSTREKFDKIRGRLAGMNTLVAFSGGVDSTVLASVTKEVASKAILLTISSPTVPQSELEEAKTIAGELGMELKIRDFDWLSEPQLSSNLVDRCYHCKKLLSKIWVSTAAELDLDIVVEGTTASEIEGYRPGIKALEDSGVISPFLEAGLTKEELREYARERGLSVAEKTSMACLATRFPYGTKIDSDLINMVEAVETAVLEIFGVKCVRARYHGDLVRIEVGSDELERMFDTAKLKLLEKIARDAGFTYVTLDLRGYRTGAMDENLQLREN